MRQGFILFAALLASVFLLNAGTFANDNTIVETSMQDASVLANVDPIEDVIEKQLKAFRERDARAAFALTSAKIQGKYKDDEKRFLQMTRYLYKPLYENLSYTFLDRAAIGDARIQKLEVIDPDGVPTIAIYRIILSDEGDWLVDGYTLLEAESEPI